MSSEQIKQKAERLRSVPLESVLRHWGALPDRCDKSKWHTSRGILSVNGATAAGAELRGTSSTHWRGMAPGSRKNLGFFSISAPVEKEAGEDPLPIILCESAIDAISCLALHPGHWCISTSGARPNPSWLPHFIARGRTVYCGFDDDDTGESMARAMIGFIPRSGVSAPPGTTGTISSSLGRNPRTHRRSPPWLPTTRKPGTPRLLGTGQLLGTSQLLGTGQLLGTSQLLGT